MQALRDQIVEQQRAVGVRVIKVPHALGFLDHGLPPANRRREHDRIEFGPTSCGLDTSRALVNNEFIRLPNITKH
jgi:hypothetical protein